MPLLLLFAFVAGIITVLSPCILPVLPIILSGSLTGGKKKPLGVITGFILSFTFFTLFSFTLLNLFGISTEVLRTVAVVVLILAGMTLFVPKLNLWMEILTGKLMAKLSQPRGHGPSAEAEKTVGSGGSQGDSQPEPKKKEGFGGGLVIGISLGLFWTPCVGPILAGVITLAATSNVTLEAALITLAYAIGTAIPMFIITWGGRHLLQRVPWVTRNASKVQKVFGVIMVVLAIALFFNLDRKFQTWVLDTFPEYGTGLTKIEETDMIQEEINRLQENAFNSPSETVPAGTESGSDVSDKTMTQDSAQSPYPLAPNPNFDGATKWLNSEPLTLEELRGKVVVVDFWTYTCINCIRTMPYITSWYDTYKDDGLVIIGVHTPEFEFERNENNVRGAMADYGINYPVVQDNEYKIWRSYNNRYWPAKYFIDKSGRLRHQHFGEGEYEESEQLIRELLAEDAPDMADSLSSKRAAPQPDLITGNYNRTPESYLGYGRIARFHSEQPITKNAPKNYTAPQPLSELLVDGLAYEGSWNLHEESAAPAQGAKLHLNFEGKEVYLVMRAEDGTENAVVKVWLNGEEISAENAGDDVQNGQITVTADRLYKLIKLPAPGNGILTLEFLDGNADLYAFTFG